jgi:hypothetical protein
MSPTHFKILQTLVAFEKKKQLKEYDSVYPSRETIAFHSKCSVNSVKKFLKKYGTSVGRVQRKNQSTKRNMSNLYLLPKSIMEIMIDLEFLGLTSIWQSCKKEIVTKMGLDYLYLKKRVRGVMENEKRTRGFDEIVPAMNSSSINTKKDSLPPKSSPFSSAFSCLSKKTRRLFRFMSQFAYEELQKAYLASKDSIRSLDGWIRWKLKDILKYELQIVAGD